METATVALALFGFGIAAAVGGVTRWDAGRVGVSRPLLWACATSGTVAFGVVLFLFTSAPMPGVLMTANTGSVLYGFERELTRRDDQPAEPGQLPFEPVRGSTEGRGTEPSERSSGATDAGSDELASTDE